MVDDDAVFINDSVLCVCLLQKFMLMHNQDQMSHFYSNIIKFLAYIDPDYYWPKKNECIKIVLAIA